MKINIVFEIGKTDLDKLSNLLDRDLLSKNIAYVVREIIGRQYIEHIMGEFDEFSLYFNEDDPAAPENWREEFHSHLLENLHDNLEVGRDTISLGFGNKNFLGYTEGRIDPSDTTPLVWFVFYLEGLVGEYAFIDEELFYEKKGPRTDLGKYGRFGRGFMISKEDYASEGWEDFKSFEEVRFPFSGEKPKDFFRESWDKVDINKNDFKKAVIATLEGRVL